MFLKNKISYIEFQFFFYLFTSLPVLLIGYLCSERGIIEELKMIGNLNMNKCSLYNSITKDHYKLIKV